MRTRCRSTTCQIIIIARTHLRDEKYVLRDLRENWQKVDESTFAAAARFFSFLFSVLEGGV